MKDKINYVSLLFVVAISSAKEIQLPPCPTNIQYFPQNLPLHCKMPPNAQVIKLAVPPGVLSPFSGPPPGLPISIPFPGPMPINGPMSVPIPGPMPVAGPLPMPMPSPASPSAKVPVIVMPFYSPDPAFKKHKSRKPRPSSTESDKNRHSSSSSSLSTNSDRGFWSGDSSSSDTSSSSDPSSGRGIWRKYKGRLRKGWRRFKGNSRRFNRQLKEKRRRRHKADPLTPILQYVTKDGYVIYEKKISKGEAKDWLNGQSIDKNDEPAMKQVQVKMPTKARDKNIVEVKTFKNYKTAIVELNDDNNFDFEINKSGGHQNINEKDKLNKKQNSSDHSKEDNSDGEKVKVNVSKRRKYQSSSKMPIEKPQRRRSKPKQT